MQSFSQSSTKELGVTPFLLNSETEKSPSYFEVLFEILGIRYRYGFEVTDKEVVGEWLYESKKNAEKLLFIRERDGIEVSKSYKEAENLESKTRDNALFLSVIDQFNGVVAKRIMNWFNNFITISGLTHENYELVTFKMLDKKNTAKILGNFYDQLDLGFEGLSVDKEKFNPKRIPEDAPEALVKFLVKDLEGALRFKIKTLHKKFDKKNKKNWRSRV